MRTFFFCFGFQRATVKHLPYNPGFSECLKQLAWPSWVSLGEEAFRGQSLVHYTVLALGEKSKREKWERERKRGEREHPHTEIKVLIPLSQDLLSILSCQKLTLSLRRLCQLFFPLKRVEGWKVRKIPQTLDLSTGPQPSIGTHLLNVQ